MMAASDGRSRALDYALVSRGATMRAAIFQGPRRIEVGDRPDPTLVKIPGSGHDDPTLRSLLALSDVMCTGHHAAVSGGVKSGDTVAVVGDGAVGLCAMIAAKRLGAGRIIALSRNPARQALAREFGATDILAERGDAATAAVMAMTDGIGVDAALECVGTNQSMATALAIARPGSMVGR